MVAVTGIGSGLDIDSLVSQLVAAERAPRENRLLRQEASITSELSAFGSLKGALGGVQSALEALTRASTFTGRSLASSDNAVLTGSAGASAVPGSYSVSVDRLASAQSVASGAFGGAQAAIGEGTLTLRFGTLATSGSGAAQTVDSFSGDPERDPLVLTIDSSNNTLEGIRDSINALEDAGVRASIVNDSGGARLLLSGGATGAANSFTLEVSDSGDGNNTDAAGLSRLAFNTDSANLEQTVAAQDASFSINGLALNSASNQLDDVIEGLSLQLKFEQTAPVTLTVSENRGAVVSAVNGFINAYNQYVKVANSLTRYDAETGSAGALQGDFSARAVISQVRGALQGAAGLAGEGVDSLAELGIQTNVDGSLRLDSEALNAALNTDSSRVASLFSDADKGVALRLDGVLQGFLGSAGLLDSRTDSLSSRIEGIEASREALNRRMESVEARYFRQFNALDTLLAEVESTGNFLTQQLASIPLPGSSSNS